MELFKKKTRDIGQWGGLTTINAQRLFNLAYAKSGKISRETGEGEQIFLAPQPGSRIMMIDDLKTDEPLMDGPCVILETSSENFQHFYVADQALDTNQRGQLQQVLAKQFDGDIGATSGSQPHRCPGSVNYKPGRGLFVTRLVHLAGSGAPLKLDVLLQAADPAQSGKTAVPAQTEIKKTSTKKDGVDQSRVDWGWVMRNKQLGRDALIEQLSAKSIARGKDPEYARRTVLKALSL